MTIRLPTPSAVNSFTLSDELVAAGLPRCEPRQVTDDNGTVVLELPVVTEAQRTAAQAVVSAHTGAPSAQVANATTLRQRATAALNANTTFLAIASPTNAQTLAQVQTLTKECAALIRLALNLLDTTAGT